MHGIRLTEMLGVVKDTSGNNDFDFKNVLSLEGIEETISFIIGHHVCQQTSCKENKQLKQ